MSFQNKINAAIGAVGVGEAIKDFRGSTPTAGDKAKVSMQVRKRIDTRLKLYSAEAKKKAYDSSQDAINALAEEMAISNNAERHAKVMGLFPTPQSLALHKQGEEIFERTMKDISSKAGKIGEEERAKKREIKNKDKKEVDDGK